MGAGKYRESIAVLLPPAGVSDGQGGILPGAGPDTEVPIRARVEPLSGRAQLALGLVATGQGYTVTIRANGPAAIPPNARLRWRGKTLTVQSFAEAERHHEIVLTCFDNGRN